MDLEDIVRMRDLEIRALKERIGELEAKDKTETQRLTDKVGQLEKDLAAAASRADRYEVALEKGLDPVRAKRLTGTTREELEADAEELAAWRTDTESEPAPTPGKPAADLKGGGDPTAEPAIDVAAIVDSIDRRF
jgi:hypothetical protein